MVVLSPLQPTGLGNSKPFLPQASLSLSPALTKGSYKGITTCWHEHTDFHTLTETFGVSHIWSSEGVVKDVVLWPCHDASAAASDASVVLRDPSTALSVIARTHGRPQGGLVGTCMKHEDN